jgi:hypothetical protein
MFFQIDFVQRQVVARGETTHERGFAHLAGASQNQGFAARLTISDREKLLRTTNDHTKHIFLLAKACL